MLPYARFFSFTFLMLFFLFSLIEPFTTINSVSHLFKFQHSDQTIFLRQTSISDHQTRPDLHNSEYDRSQIRPPYPSTTSDYPQTQKNTNHDNQAIRSATTTIADYQIRSSQQTTILDYSYQLQISPK